ncbi:hypothetical protein DMN91_004377 [Ooceraea biroi]|uniref:Uncharacterized protein n=1 Tax=Ooceraea biroi TaxID=2015173 RepID=A0A3L8DUQ4_OOCBI|nr:uncharacterized protein LOC105283565 [Ooceraea biroi]RLU24167.1 hypothetical protein DMN91_004377 [Ooceraea biroi]
MCRLSINSFIASWLLFCLINPLCSEAEKSYRFPYEANDPAYHQFQPLQSEAASIEERHRANNPELLEKSHYNLYHHNYQPNAVHSRISSKNIYPAVHVKSNVAKAIPEYQVEKEYKSRYGLLGSQYVKNQRILKKESDIRFPQQDEEVQRRDEEITKKMNALDKYLSEDNDDNNVESKNTIEERSIVETNIPEETKRVVRQVRRQRPGFFWTLARLAFETFNDTRSAIQQISNIINENFEPDTSTRQPVTSNSFMVTSATVASSNDQSNMSSNMAGVNVTTMTTTSTTQAPFKLTRNSLQNLIRRNLRGLVRLFNIEWQDALNQSEANVREFQKNLGNQVGSFLQDNPDAF